MDQDTLNDVLRNIVELSPAMALLVSLIFLGMFLKKTPLQDWVIPLVLMTLGGAIYPFVAEAAKITNYTVRSPFIYSILTGGCIGGAATGLHQVVKKFMQRNLHIDLTGENGDTKIITKDSIDIGADIVKQEKEIDEHKK